MDKILTLDNDFHIDYSDRRNITLVERYIGKDKDGGEKEQERDCGYFPTFAGALTKYANERLRRGQPHDVAAVLERLNEVERTIERAGAALTPALD